MNDELREKVLGLTARNGKKMPINKYITGICILLGVLAMVHWVIPAAGYGLLLAVYAVYRVRRLRAGLGYRRLKKTSDKDLAPLDLWVY